MAIIQRIKTKVSALKRISEGVYLVSFEVPPRQTKFSPGQFTHLTLDDFDPSLGYWPESRVFSIASEPKSENLSIVYSVKGFYTKRMEKELSVGKEVWLKFPYGDFSVKTLAGLYTPVIIISGGTGISPFIPFLKETVAENSSRKIHHFHGLRKNEMLIFENDLSKAALLSGFEGFLYVEEEEPSEVLTHWQTRKGRLNLDQIYQSYLELGHNTLFFLSGPPEMIRFFKNGLLTKGIDEFQIKIDSWE